MKILVYEIVLNRAAPIKIIIPPFIAWVARMRTKEKMFEPQNINLRIWGLKVPLLGENLILSILINIVPEINPINPKKTNK